MYGMVAQMPLRGLVKNNVLKMMESMYSSENKTFGNDLDSIGNNQTVELGMRVLASFNKAKRRLNGLLNR